MTHADLRARLRAYADGTLDDPDADAVRAHLATGCPTCLRDVFTRPTGLPRPPVVVARTPRGLVAAAVIGAAAVGVGIGAMLGMTWNGPVERSDPSVASLAVEVERLRRIEASRDDRSGASVPPSTIPVEPNGGPPRVAGEPDAVPSWLADLLASDGARVVPLEPAAAAPGARGYVVWSPARGVVVVSAAALPADPRTAVYRVRVTLHDGSTVWVGDLPAPEHDPLVVTVEMPEGAGRRVIGVDLYRDPPGAPALSARLRS